MALFQSKQELLDFLDNVIISKREFLSYQTKKTDIARQEGMLKALVEIRTVLKKKVPGWRVLPPLLSDHSESKNS